MEAIGGTPEIELVQRCFQALGQGDFAVLEASLAEDARWRTAEEGATNCEGRSTIVGLMRRNLAGRLRGNIEEASQSGSRVIVGFRPERPSDGAGRPLDGGIAYMVVTILAGKITELRGCADRAAAVRSAETGEIASTEGTGVRPTDTPVEPPEQRVGRLVPFVEVAEVERSVAFYHQLGFTPGSVYEYRGLLGWAALESDGAEVMFQRGDPVDPERQGILFYLYSDDLAALRDQLLAAGIEAGEIEDGAPGPRHEMRVVDPDGYVLMIAQNG